MPQAHSNEVSATDDDCPKSSRPRDGESPTLLWTLLVVVTAGLCVTSFFLFTQKSSDYTSEDGKGREEAVVPESKPQGKPRVEKPNTRRERSVSEPDIKQKQFKTQTLKKAGPKPSHPAQTRRPASTQKRRPVEERLLEGQPPRQEGADLLTRLFNNVGGKVIRFGQTMTNTLVRYAQSKPLTSRDKFYARLIKETYPDKDAKPPQPQRLPQVSSETEGVWVRQDDLDSKYVSVWDQRGSNKRFVAVRGTKTGHGEDIFEDIRIAFRGTCQDRIGADLNKIMQDSVSCQKSVEIGGHSLGCTLVFSAYEKNTALFNWIVKTYQFNPPYCPRWLIRGKVAEACLSKRFENLPNIRWFINLYDLVSLGGTYDKGPADAVYFHAADAGVSGWELSLENGVEVVKTATKILDQINDGENTQLHESMGKFLSVHKLSQWIEGKK